MSIAFTELSSQSLILTLGGLMVLSAFFSSSETAMMSLDRYRLKHLTASRRSARIAEKLLSRPDRLLGVILIGNNFVNILASSLATVLAIRWYGDIGVPIATGVLTIIILIFAEVSPKTMAALYPEKIAFPASYVLRALLTILYPLVWTTNAFSNCLLSLFGMTVSSFQNHTISREELKTVVTEAQGHMPHHHDMLLGILDLDLQVVDEIMVPSHEISGIDCLLAPEVLKSLLVKAQHTWLPVFEGDIDHIKGLLHVRSALKLIQMPNWNADDLKQLLVEPYFIPEGTSLLTQLNEFKARRKRLAMVVNEYGDIVGLLTLEDILEEIVGEYTSDIRDGINRMVRETGTANWLLQGATPLKDAQEKFDLTFPETDAKTIAGLILETLGTIPLGIASVRFNDVVLEIVKIEDHTIKSVRLKHLEPVTREAQNSK